MKMRVQILGSHVKAKHDGAPLESQCWEVKTGAPQRLAGPQVQPDWQACHSVRDIISKKKVGAGKMALATKLEFNSQYLHSRRHVPATQACNTACLHPHS